MGLYTLGNEVELLSTADECNEQKLRIRMRKIIFNEVMIYLIVKDTLVEDLTDM